MTRTHGQWTVLAALVACVAAAPPLSAGEIDWPDPRGGVIVDHQPLQSGGPASDTEFLDMLGNPFWQQVADNVLIPGPALVRRVVWWGFYNLDNPPVEETMRLRFYDARPTDGLPGDVLFEESFLNPTRVATGRQILVDFTPDEFIYHVDLTIPFDLDASVPYWLEITQIGDVDTAFRREFAFTDQDSFARRNPFAPNWAFSALDADLAFQLLSIPEPSTLVLFVFASIVLLRRSRGT